MGVITVEPPYHTQVWKYPPWGFANVEAYFRQSKDFFYFFFILTFLVHIPGTYFTTGMTYVYQGGLNQQAVATD